ncbi:MAG: type II toxin-antitoxin system HicA family toxin [Fimbriimonadaceae bacterium]
MKRRELERHLRSHQARLVRHGSRHDIWENSDGEKESQIPRHQMLKKNVARRICDDLGVPRHPSL